jgi:CHAD domain-containing protein
VLRALGPVRDLDVALREMETFSRELPKSERHSIEPLRRYLAAERLKARTRMLSVLDSVPVQKSFQELTSLLSAPSVQSDQPAAESALEAAPKLIRQRFRKLRKSADLLTADSSTEAFHEVRGHVKKFRYALEAVAAMYGKPADEMLRSMRRWQESLGVQQDAAVASRRLKALAAAPPKGIPRETLFLMGRLAERYASDALRARKLYAKGYRKMRRRWKKLRMKFADLSVTEIPNAPDSGS